MATSKSVKELKKWIAGASIFSGRPDPTWQVQETVARKLLDTWDSLELSTRGCPPAPPLGYRGCFLRCTSDQEWFAYGGVVTLKTSDRYESRRDKDRMFEKKLLASAPDGLFPTPHIMNE